MPLYQKSVLNKYLKGLEFEKIAQAYERFTSHFHNPTIQENIRNSKEEQYQGEFLIDLFVNVLGYTKNPTPDFNLTTELKNIKGSKKTDGAILKGEKALAVIELKGTNTTDLSKVETQAFGYKNNQPGCNYVITSNFEKLRFYIDNAVDFEEFNLFQLSKERFDILWLCLSSENLLKNLPKRIKDESLTQEENVTKKLYKDYAAFRNEIFDAIQKENPEYDKLTLFKKTQKLLDRFLFIFFAEDRLLLPPNSIREIVNQWKTLKDELDAYVPLYDRFKKYFGYLNTGHKDEKHDIFAYNGGLFAPDDILDNIKINDDLLYKHSQNLSNYDFESEVSVNILGHIFEHSLNDIDEIQAEIQGVATEQSKTKRKKDGVFYTPKYITKYIIDYTVGKLCEEKKAKLDIQETEYEKERKGRQKTTLKKLSQKLEDYRKWLLRITICDPACGSGAFLNQALEFLIAEHQYIDELQAKLFGDAMVLSDIENAILENNLFGVDINEESVEIAKLSLWLRTAQKGRKLTALNNNIKCGNSLIDDPTVAGDKAFNWQNEFPEVFTKGGFDVVIGNPPYVRAELLSDYRGHFEENYEVFNPASDLFAYFYELGSIIIKKQNGLMGFISNTFDKTTAGKVLRAYLTAETTFHHYIDFTEVQVFEGATTYPVIIILDKNNISNEPFRYIKIPKEKQSKVIDIDSFHSIEIDQETLSPESWSFLPKEKVNLLDKLVKLPTIREMFGKCYRSLITGLNDAFIVQNNWQISNHVKHIYEGKEIKKWCTPNPKQKLVLFESKWTKSIFGNDTTEEESLSKLTARFPELLKHLLPFKEKAKKRYDKGDFWWELRNCAYYDLFDQPKIIFPNLQNINKFSIDSKGVFVNAPAVFLPTTNKTLLCILNSKLVWTFLKSICVVRSGGYIEVKPQYFEQIPLPDFKNEYVFESRADKMIQLTDDFQKIENSFMSLLLSKFNLEKPSKKLQNWHELDFGEFLKELEKARKKSSKEKETENSKLSLSEEAEWMQYFNEQRQKAEAIKTEIDKTDREIDQMVYKLYGLTEEEIAIVEQS